MDPHGEKQMGPLHERSNTALTHSQARRAFCGMFGINGFAQL